MPTKEKIKITLIVISSLISLGQLISSFLLIPHIFGILFSGTILIINMFYLAYLIVFLQKIEADYKVQYELMGKKRNETCF